MFLAHVRRPFAVVAFALAFVLAPASSYAAPVLAPSAAKVGVKVVKAPGTVQRGLRASVSIKTAPKASCSITVRYKTGPSTAAGLGGKAANAGGMVIWSWLVGGNTTPGTWPVIISCAGQGVAQTSITVKAKAETQPRPTPNGLNTHGQDLYNCGDFAIWQQANAVYQANLPGDPNDLDRDRDGIPCESLPGAP